MSVLDTEILNLDGNSWQTRDAAAGTMVFGMTGSGKSSGPLRHIALQFLRQGYGGIVFCAKPDEPGTWEDYCKETGRLDDLLYLSRETFAFLDYEFSRPVESGGGLVENVVNIFMEVVKISKDKKSAGTSDEYWQNAIKQFLRNTISLLVLAGEPVTLPNIKRVIDTAIRSGDTAASVSEYIEQFEAYVCSNADIEQLWQENGREGFETALTMFQDYYAIINGEAVGRQLLDAANQYAAKLLIMTNYLRKAAGPDYELALNYFLVEFPQLDERTRSNTVSSFTVLADAMLRGEFLRCFGSESSTLALEDLYRRGKILIVDQDVKQFGLVGQMTAAIIKLCFQKMIERREDITDPEARPVFLWADECQFFAIDYDQKFQTTARSSRTLTVYATQNLGNLHDGYGKEKAASLLGNLGTKFFCQNGDHETNKWAADSIGQEIIRRRSQNLGDSLSGGLKGDYNKSDNYSEGWSEQKDYLVDIISFTTLQAGGPRGQCKVGYVFWQSGRILKDGSVYLRSAFKQKCRRVCGARFERRCPSLPQKNAGNERKKYLYWYDFCYLAVFMAGLAAASAGLYAIYSGSDHVFFEVTEIGYLTAGSIGIWCLAFTFDAVWHLGHTVIQVVWAVISRKPRKKYRFINRMPLVFFTWVYLVLSLFLTVFFQNGLYKGKIGFEYLGIWLAMGFLHRFLKSTGGKRITMD